MNIVILDRDSIGRDLDLTELEGLGSLRIYDTTSPNEVNDRITDADVIILNKVKIGEDNLCSAGSLKLICISATGFDNVDLDAARKHGVAVCNVPGYSTESVVQLTLACALSLVCHLREYNQFVIDGSYSASGLPNRLTPTYHEISGMTWGIIGYGNIGRSVATVARAMGAKVIFNRRTPTGEEGAVDIKTLLKESDIISIHCPLNDSSRGLISSETLKIVKPNAIIINMARGAVVDNDAIVDAVTEGKIGGFASDVFDVEPIGSEHPLMKLASHPNVLLTPHCAWGAFESRCRCLSIIISNIRAFNDGKSQNRVDILKQ
ncbi:MAG: hydroxyacid dehydrogenase [Clostridia bacterium]|nr:hydroxyacid dehydrogenase [Clostridia bacterium]